MTGLGAQRSELASGAVVAAYQMFRTASAATCFRASGSSGYSMVTRVRPHNSCQNA